MSFSSYRGVKEEPSNSTISHLCPSISEISSSEERVNALYSPFRPRELNPESYDHKIKFWTKGVEEFVYFGGRFSFTLKELQKGLMIAKKTPACLEEVLQICNRNGSILTEKEFYDKLVSSVSWVAWSQVNAKKYMSKLVPLSSVWAYFSRGQGAEVRYVHVAYLKSIIDDLTKASNLKNRLLSLESFKELISAQTRIKDPLELNVLLDYMKTTKLIEMDSVGTEVVVLFGDVLKITDVDKGKYDVKRSIEIHEQRLEETQGNIDEAIANAKKALKQGRRATAKHELKKKKMLEARHEKLLTVVDSLTVISMKLEDAESDAKILAAYQSGKQALSDVLKKNNMTADSVTDAMLDVQDVLEEHAEVSAAILQPLDGQDDDLAELDAELEAMLNEDAADKEKQRLEELRKQQEEEDTLRLLEGLKFGDDLNESLLNGTKDSDNIPSPASITHE